MVARIPTVFSTLIHRRRRCVAAEYERVRVAQLLRRVGDRAEALHHRGEHR
jgi:hypothetical protein